MILNRKVKIIAAITLIIASMSFMAGCKSKTSVKEGNTPSQTEQKGSTTTDGKQQGDNKEVKEVSIDDWKYEVPTGYELEENGGPWYEKRYANQNGAVLIFGYYAPNGIDNRTDKQIFAEQRDIEKQDMTSRYGAGEITYEDVNNESMIITTYYETRDLKVLKRSKLEEKIWKALYIQIPISESEEDYESMLDIVK